MCKHLLKINNLIKKHIKKRQKFTFSLTFLCNFQIFNRLCNLIVRNNNEFEFQVQLLRRRACMTANIASAALQGVFACGRPSCSASLALSLPLVAPSERMQMTCGNIYGSSFTVKPSISVHHSPFTVSKASHSPSASLRHVEKG